MNIYINNEEVVCNSKMTIKESLSNTSSVILNNVYPKSWENDRDYTSRFYMPKDYSHCVITDDNVTNEVIQETFNEQDITLTTPAIQEISYSAGGKVGDYYENEIIEYDPESYLYEKGFIIPNEDGLIKLENLSATQTPRYYYIYYTNDSTLQIGTKIYRDASRSSSVPAGQTIDIKKDFSYIVILCSQIAVTNVYLRKYYKFTNTYTNHILFSGYVKNSGNINLNPRYPHYSTLQLLDYKALLSEGDTLNYVMESMKVSAAIRKVVEELEGFEVGVIWLENDEEIRPYNCNEKTPYDVLEYLAEISGSRWITETKDEETTFISFYSPSFIPEAEQIEYTTNYFNAHNIQDIKYSYSAKDYRNKQTIVSEDVLSTLLQIERLTCNGTINYETNSKIGEIVSIVSGDTTYTAITNTEKNYGYVADFYYDYNSNKLTSENAYGYGRVFTISYYPVVTSRQVVYNQTEIDRINESTARNGIIARYEKRTDTNNNKELNQIAQSYIDYKGAADITLTIQTYNYDLLKLGSQVFFNGPLNDLKTKYLVIEKQSEMITTADQQELFYTYKLSSSFNDENAINYFDNQRRKLSGNIGEGEYITRYIDIPSTTNIIFYDFSKIETEIPGDILDGELDIELVETGMSNKLDAKLEFIL